MYANLYRLKKLFYQIYKNNLKKLFKVKRPLRRAS